MVESERVIIRPLEEVFDRRSIENLRANGVCAVIPIEVSIEDLMRIAKSKGYEANEVDPDPDQKSFGLGMYWVYLKPEGLKAVVFYTKPVTDGKAVYILDDEFEAFKEMFLEGAVG